MLPLRKHKVKLGSPPRGRGKGKDYATAETMQGITPAWAGKSWLSLDSCWLWWDHPRMGGEKLPRKFTKAANPGSPPHGRGKVNLSILEGADTGITPAWAGKSMQAALRSSSAGDHPRMGGEKCKPAQRTAPHQGSPPHGRGKGSHAAPVVGTGGITPAWAGKSHPRTAPRHRAQDHPRMGGEKGFPTFWSLKNSGSPPHGRGKVCPGFLIAESLRITPAWAGKRKNKRKNVVFYKDHPRMGGEKRFRSAVRWSVRGSPPHGRGKVEDMKKAGLNPRITPAWAGKRLKRSHRSGIFISGPIPFHSVLHRPAGSGGSRAGRDGSPAGQPQNAGPA